MGKEKSHLSLVKLGLIIGIITGLLSIGFNYGVQKLIQVMMLYHPIPFQTRMIFIPVLGGLFLGIMHKYVIGEADYGFGVSGVMEEIKSINNYLMRPIVVLAKTLSTIFTLAIGWSAGKHGPVVYIGGAVGSWIGYTYNFSRDHIKILIACGVSGALAGVFNEPIFATLFVLEVLLHKDYLKYFTPVTVSAISASAMTHIIGSDQRFINVEGVFNISSDMELVWMVLLGIAMGLMAVAYIRTLKITRQIFSKWNAPVIKGLVGGVIISVGGYFLPELYDIHLNTTARIVSGAFGLRLLILLVIGKIILTGITLGAGGVGGVFSPGLFIGAASGYLIGMGLETLPFAQISGPGTYAVVGMAAMFAGFGNAPLSATLLAVELTGQEGLILPFLITTVVASVVTEAIQKDSIYGHSNFVWAGKDYLVDEKDS